MPAKKPYVLAVVGSPRKKGNSDTLCTRVLAGARAAGARTEKVYLQDLGIQPCRACEACLRAALGECVLHDGMKPLYPKLRECDALVIASPIYFLSLSAQTTLFLNRLYPILNPQGIMLGAKKMVGCLTYGDADPLTSGCDNAVRILRDLAGFAGIQASFVHASALHVGDVQSNKPAMALAYKTGKGLVGKAR